MRFGIKNLSLLTLSISLLCSHSMAYEFCSSENFLRSNTHQTGFFFDKTELNILKTRQPLARNRNLTSQDMEARVLESIKKTRPALSGLTDERLASLILKAVDTTGVDFQILSSMIYQETKYCKDRHNNSSGASGCTQFTSVALNELKHQFGVAGPKYHAKGVPQIMRAYVKVYFAGDSIRERAWYNWLGSSIRNMQDAFRARSNFDIDILAGALLLKIYLAKKNGNYYEALVQYNGDSTMVKRGRTIAPYKTIYAGEIQGRAMNISLDEITCLEATTRTNDLINNSCDLFDEALGACSDPLTEPNAPELPLI